MKSQRDRIYAKLIELHEQLSLEVDEIEKEYEESGGCCDYSSKMDFWEGKMEMLSEIEYFVKHMED